MLTGYVALFFLYTIDFSTIHVWLFVHDGANIALVVEFSHGTHSHEAGVLLVSLAWNYSTCNGREEVVVSDPLKIYRLT
jgi:hypothetical protein